MFCSQCGRQIDGTERTCPSCGAPVAAGKGAAVAQMPERVSFEYARTTVSRDLATVTTDCYESLGYELTGSKSTPGSSSTTLSFRRSRKIKGKAQLVKLQRTMDDLIASIARFEDEKTKKATVYALVLGIASALVLGVGMCCTMVWDGLMVIGIIVGLVGIVGCVGAWLLYRQTVARETKRIAPSIEAAYDSLATACEEAQTVLGAA